MGFFDTEEGVDEYARMAEGYDGRELVDRLIELLPKGGELLELGMGLGKDLDMLREHFRVIGSDTSKVFLRRYAERVPEVELLELDAVTLDGLVDGRRFDAIYSNKVLHHLTSEDLGSSLQRQAEVLRDGGVAIHSLWYGEGERDFSGLRFVYYTDESFAALLPDTLALESCERYCEMEDGDSMLAVLRRRSRP